MHESTADPTPSPPAPRPEPTDRELAILKVLWRRGEGTVRQVYEDLREEIPIVQNTVQAFLRIMEDKGLVNHRTRGRTFVYRPSLEEDHLEGRLVDRLLRRVFDGALDQLVERALAVKPPTEEEIRRLRALLDAHAPARKGRRVR